MRCRICRAYIPEGAEHCLDCGTAIDQVVTCLNCGNPLRTDSKFCNKCGAPSLQPSNNPSGEEDVLAKEEVGQLPIVACPKCRGGIDKNVSYCPWCGVSLDRKTKTVEKIDVPAIDLATREAESESCPRCGTEPRGSARFCHGCGRFLGGDIEEVVCADCGSTNKIRYARCQYCGSDLPAPPKSDQ